MVDPASASLRAVPVLVTGASGFIGRRLAAELLRRGAEVTLAARDPDRLAAVAPAVIAHPGANVAQVDGLEPGAFKQLIAAKAPAVVFHLAGYGVAKHERDEAAMHRLNRDLVAEIVEALACTPATGQPNWPGLRLVHTGSAFEYGQLRQPLDEGADAQPFTAYGESKLAGTRIVQRAVRERGLPALVARPFTVFGPGERDGRLFPTLLAARHHGDPIPLSTGEQERDFALVCDVAAALADLAQLDATAVTTRVAPFEHSVLNLASGVLQRVRDFVLATADAFGIARERLQFGAIPQLAEDLPHPPVPVERLRRALSRTLPSDLPALLLRVVAESEPEV